MSKIVIVYHSGYGHTKKVAEAVLAGAHEAGADAKLMPVGELDDAAWAELDAADAIIFGAPTYMGGPSADFKKFADASSKPWFAQKWKDKIAAGFTNSATMNGDKFLDDLVLRHAGDAARHDLGGHGHDAVEHEGRDAQRPELRRRLYGAARRSRPRTRRRRKRRRPAIWKRRRSSARASPPSRRAGSAIARADRRSANWRRRAHHADLEAH